MTNAAAAAEELALQLPVARESARAAARCALKGKLTTPRPDPRPQDELVVGEEEYSPGPIVRGPNYHPRTYERER